MTTIQAEAPDRTTTTALSAVLSGARSGDVIELSGIWAPQTVTNYTPASDVTIVSLPGTALAGLTLTNCQNLQFVDLNIDVTEALTSQATATALGILSGGANLHFHAPTVNATGAQRAVKIQGLTAMTDWPDHVVFEDGEIWGSAGDLAAVYRGLDVTFHRMTLRDPVIADDAVDHIDCIQGTHWIGGAITECVMYETNPPDVFGGPHQGIILSTIASDTEICDSVTVAGNWIGGTVKAPAGAGWRGTGLILSGAQVKRVKAYGNVIANANGGVAIGIDDHTPGIGTEAYANDVSGV